jgi:transposase-like protein
MGRPSRFSPEVRERAVRMVEEHREAHASEWAVLQSVAPKLGCRRKRSGSGCGRRSVMPAIGRG